MCCVNINFYMSDEKKASVTNRNLLAERKYFAYPL
jgi:hypothetical protein